MRIPGFFLPLSGTISALLISLNCRCTSLLVLALSSPEPTRRSFISKSAATVATSFSIAPIANAETAPAVLYPGGSAALPKASYSEDGAWSPSPELITTSLGKQRFLTTELSPLQQILPFGDQELYYAPWLFGSWMVKAQLKNKKYPFGTEYLPSKSLVEGSPRNRNEQVDDTTTYEAHYFSTLANTKANQVTVNLGLGAPKTKIIADRAFNAISVNKAYNQLAPVESVDWDYSKDPTKLTLNFGAGLVAEDMRPLGQRRAEVYLTARTSEEGLDNESGSLTYCTAERSRTVTLAPGNVIVSDVEHITEFRKVDDDTVTAVSRIAVYLTPNPNSREGVLWQQVGGKAVAFFDYKLEMKRQKESFNMKDGTTMERACVKTPKDVIQCS